MKDGDAENRLLDSPLSFVIFLFNIHLTVFRPSEIMVTLSIDPNKFYLANQLGESFPTVEIFTLIRQSKKCGLAFAWTKASPSANQRAHAAVIFFQRIFLLHLQEKELSFVEDLLQRPVENWQPTQYI